MTQEELYAKLNYVDATRHNRLKYSELVLADPRLFETLLKILFMVEDSISCRAAWILEFTTNKKLKIIYPHLDYFTKNIQRLKLQSSIRPAAKVCENLMVRYYVDKESDLATIMNTDHKEKIIEFCFEILIGEHKVAPKAYSMTSLALLSKEFNWIKSDLKNIIEKDYANQSAGYKARARKILKQLKS